MARLVALGIVLIIAAGGLVVGRWISAPTPAATFAVVPVRTQVTDDHYELVLELPKSTWHTNEVITGRATLHLVTPTTMTVWGSGGGLLGFKYSEVGGDKKLDWLRTMDCGATDLAAGRPVVSPLTKSGGYSADAPPTDFYRVWGEDPLIHLPVGDWKISAVTDFTEVNCGGDLRHNLEATVVIHVVP
jgi:hypothetical protein